jgi:flagellar L-ring protein FlgH
VLVIKFKSVAVLILSMFMASVSATSLFNDADFKSLTSDKRARKVGDTVTIIVLENAQAKTSAGNSQDNGFSISASAQSPNGSWPYGVGMGSDHSGNAAIQRNGFIKAQITAVVKDKDKHGNLIVHGKQNISIDGEVQTIEITGSVRNSDIFSDNTLLSSRLFDANIIFTGKGPVSENQEGGIVYKVFNWLGLI